MNSMTNILPTSLYGLSLLRRSIFSSSHNSTRQYSCRIRQVWMSSTANLSRCQVQVELRRLNHSLKNDDQISDAANTGSSQIDDSTQQTQNLPSAKRKVDPFAKRPTQKCDPYGLAGQSLSLKECIDWLATLEEGWKLIHSTEKRAGTEVEAPTFLQKQFYHSTFHDASQFLSHISLLSTNLNHYPFLSMERLLVDDLSEVSNSATSGSVQTSKQKRKRVKGWVFVSTVRCSTYRPPTTRVAVETHDDSPESKEKGLTYHDFHLAMNIDIESNREKFTTLLL